MITRLASCELLTHGLVFNNSPLRLPAQHLRRVNNCESEPCFVVQPGAATAGFVEGTPTLHPHRQQGVALVQQVLVL